jgi:hypothetical protein
MTAFREVFDSIAYCKNVALCQHGDESHSCAKIVRFQHVPDNDFQLPEPWRGQIVGSVTVSEQSGIMRQFYADMEVAAVQRPDKRIS